MMSKRINNIILHCTDSEFGNVNTIREWHKSLGWRDIGYHFVILNGHVTPDLYLRSLDGSIECGRYLDGNKFIDWREIGAHALGYNTDSIGIALVGKRVFTPNQFISLNNICLELCKMFEIPIEKILGHYETEKSHGKTCPNFDMQEYRKKLVI